MKLNFLGQKYFVNNIQVETTPSDINACFRGQIYPLRRSVSVIKPRFGIRKYRGVLYCKNF